MVSVLLRNARLADGEITDIPVVDGHVKYGARPNTEVDLERWLVLPAGADPHAHLDKALSGERIHNPKGDLDTAIEVWMEAAGELTVDDIADRTRRAIAKYLGNGITAIRTHVDVGGLLELRSVEALLQMKRELHGLIDLQLVGLVMFPLTGDDGSVNRSCLGRAIEMGIDYVGGAPAVDPDPSGALAVQIDAATDAGLPLDLHIDETLDTNVNLLDELARQVIDRGFPHRVTASHCVALGMRNPAAQAASTRLVAEAGIAVVANPQTNLFLQARGISQAAPRGITAIEALDMGGVLVAAGGDNIQDPFNLVGRGDPFETASLLVTAAHVTPETAYAMVSTRVRRVMDMPDEPLADGGPADLVAVDATTLRAAVADGAPNLRVFRRGVEVVHRRQTAQWHDDYAAVLGGGGAVEDQTTG